MIEKKSKYEYRCYECDELLFTTSEICMGKKPWLHICMDCMREKYPIVLIGSWTLERINQRIKKEYEKDNINMIML